MATNIDVITALKIRGERSPDIANFKRKENCLLFVYDDYKMGMSESLYMTKHGTYLGKSRTHTDMYLMKNHKDLPIVFDENDSKSYQKGYIWGEVYAVPPEFLIIMDQIKENGTVFERQKRSFLLTEQESVWKNNTKPFAQAYMYLGRKEYWADVKLSLASSSFLSSDYQARRNRRYEHLETVVTKPQYSSPRYDFMDGWE